MKLLFRKHVKKDFWKMIILAILLIFTGTGFYHSTKSLPEGINVEGTTYKVPPQNVEFLYDLTYQDSEKKRVIEQHIFDEFFSLIEQAEHYILMDVFLYNSFVKESPVIHRNLASELTTAILKKRKEKPNAKITVITDPINTVYGGDKNKELEFLKEKGIDPIITDLNQLRDSHPLYSSLWRIKTKWLGNSDKGGIWPHPFSGEDDKVTLRSYLAMMNFKANHRKVLVTDHQDTFATLVTSANPHDGSSAHSNVGLRIIGELGRDVYLAEKAVADFSEGRIFSPSIEAKKYPEGTVEVQLLTEKKIKEQVLEAIADTQIGDSVHLAMFYLSDRNVMHALLKAAKRGADVSLILDPNKDAFGFTKTGVPNRPVAHELVKKSEGKIKIRWYDTHGEQYHTKMLFVKKQYGKSIFILGSANFTRRNLENFNLEMNVKVVASPSTKVMRDVEKYWNRLWNNEGGLYTLEYSYYEDSSLWKQFRYRFQEFTGLSSF